MSMQTPDEMHRRFGDAANAGDADALAALYEDRATIAPPPGTANGAGGEPAREHLAHLLAMRPRFTRITTTKVFQTDDVALLCSDWEGVATGPDGNELPMQGRGTEVLRRQPDGTWLCAIDNPWGTADV